MRSDPCGDAVDGIFAMLLIAAIIGLVYQWLFK